MKIRTHVPHPLQRLGRKVTVLLGRPLANSRATPDFILVGGQRCGTTSLFRALEQHPQMVRPSFHKGINYFDLNYYRGLSWYQAHFPLRTTVTRRIPSGAAPVVFEASGYYMFHPEATARIAQDLPNVKIVVMLRDPIDRAYSAWKHERARGFETEDFIPALRLEEGRLAGEADKLQNPRYESFPHRHHAYAARSDYAPQLDRILTHFPRERLHVIYSETFFKDPAVEFEQLTAFLGALPPHEIAYDQHNARPSGSMPEEAYRILHAKLRGTYESMETLTGRRPPWDY